MKPSERAMVEAEKAMSFNSGRDKGIIAAITAFMFYMHDKQGWGQQKLMEMYQLASAWMTDYVGDPVSITDICETLGKECGIYIDPSTGVMTRLNGFTYTPNAKMVKTMTPKRRTLSVGNITDTAKEYGIPRTTLRRYIGSNKLYKGEYYFDFV